MGSYSRGFLSLLSLSLSLSRSLSSCLFVCVCVGERERERERGRETQGEALLKSSKTMIVLKHWVLQMQGFRRKVVKDPGVTGLGHVGSPGTHALGTSSASMGHRRTLTKARITTRMKAQSTPHMASLKHGAPSFQLASNNHGFPSLPPPMPSMDTSISPSSSLAHISIHTTRPACSILHSRNSILPSMQSSNRTSSSRPCSNPNPSRPASPMPANMGTSSSLSAS